eukprot:scaffold473_cov257-Pinguiococcus_pyrenoidosus.AAC.2
MAEFSAIDTEVAVVETEETPEVVEVAEAKADKPPKAETKTQKSSIPKHFSSQGFLARREGKTLQWKFLDYSVSGSNKGEEIHILKVLVRRPDGAQSCGVFVPQRALLSHTSM